MAFLPRRITAPAVQPITLEEVKRRLRVLHDHEDEDIQASIDYAVARLDGTSGLLGRAIINQTWEQAFQRFTRQMLLPMPLAPVAEPIVSVTWVDDENVMQTVDPANYRVETDYVGGPFVWFVDSYSAPDPNPNDPSPVRIQFIAGYGESAEAVPSDLRLAMRDMVAHKHEHREPIVIGAAVNDVPETALDIIETHRWWGGAF